MSFSIVSDLITGIKTNVATATSFTEIDKVSDIESLGKRFTSSRYGVEAKGSSQVDGVTRFITMDQQFDVSLTTDYVKTEISDSLKMTATNSLMNKAYDAFKLIHNNKAGVPASVMNVKDLVVDEPVYFENEDTILIKFSFIITYRLAL